MPVSFVEEIVAIFKNLVYLGVFRYLLNNVLENLPILVVAVFIITKRVSAICKQTKVNYEEIDFMKPINIFLVSIVNLVGVEVV